MNRAGRNRPRFNRDTLLLGLGPRYPNLREPSVQSSTHSPLHSSPISKITSPLTESVTYVSGSYQVSQVRTTIIRAKMAIEAGEKGAEVCFSVVEVKIKGTDGRFLPTEVKIKGTDGRFLPTEVKIKGTDGRFLPTEVKIKGTDGRFLPTEAKMKGVKVGLSAIQPEMKSAYV